MIKNRKTIIIAALIIVILVSIWGGVKWAVPTKGYAKTIEALDEKKTTVMKLTAASAAASVAVGAIPGDATTPIAEKLADVGSYFLIVLCAILLEKYLLSITGVVAFCILIPAACVLGIIYMAIGKKMLFKLASKIALLGLLIAFSIPASVGVAEGIERTYSVSIENTIDAAEEASEEVEASSVDKEDEEGFWSGLTSKITDGVSSAFESFENVLSNFMEAVAVMLVTSCVIPIVVILFFIWMIKILLGFNIDVSSLSKKITPKKTNTTHSQSS